MASFELLLTYFLRILPGLLIGLAFIFFLGRGKNGFVIRVMAYIFLFILMRDVMTPLNIWQFGANGIFWLRIINDSVFLLLVAGLSISLILIVNKLDKEANNYFIFKKLNLASTVGVGLIGAIIIICPMAIIYQFVPISERGGAVEADVLFLLSLLIFCLSANFLEESIYRGYFQGFLESTYSPVRSAILSGLLFGFSHIFLASTVTDAGWGVIAFTAFEGVVAGFVRMKGGVLASTITHGVAIYILCSGAF